MQPAPKLPSTMLWLAALPVAGVLIGGFAHLWATHGATVYLTYLAGAAFTCL